MGLLDDAIRQHLELKRRHGADPSDVAKLEHEAFGPIERDEALELPVPGASAPSREIAREEELAFEEAELQAEGEWEAGRPPVSEPAPEPEPAAAAASVLSPEPEPEPPRPGGSVRLDDVGEPTVEHAASEHGVEQQPGGEPGEHDELEETPEFLQETPEHDRLWFEQKPPRDFDF